MTLQAPTASAEELVDRVAPRPVRSSEVVLRGRVWDVRRDTVELGDAREVVREYVDHPGAVAVLALRQDRGADEVLLIQQYRHPIGAHEWELPAGLLDVEGEPARQAAVRELAEEADLRAGRWDLLADYVSSPGGMNEALRVYLARDLSDVAKDERHVRQDEEQGMPIRWVPLELAVDAVLAGRVRNVAAVVGLLSVVAARERQWSTLRPADQPWPARPQRWRTP
jgi:ADP-ribose pyrophosphatase